MSLINYASKEVTLKIVYYGPGLSGKTTNLQHLHAHIPQDRRGKLLSLATESDRTLFFDFMPMTLGKIGDFTVKFQLYTVPGQVRYNATRKLVLKGADAVVFVADSQIALKEQNVESYQNMLDNLSANNLDPEEIPIVLQFNKRDLDDIMSEDDLNILLNEAGHKTINAEALNGTGVDETFRLVTQLLLKHFALKHKIGFTQPSSTAKPRQAEQVMPTPAKHPLPSKQKLAQVPDKPEIQETIIEEKSLAVESVPDKGSTSLASEPMAAEPVATEPVAVEPVAEEAATSQEVFDESQFAPRGMPSMDEFPSPEVHPLDAAEDITEDLGSAIREIANRLKESQVEAWLEKLMFSTDSTKQAVSDLISELRESRKNQEKMIDLLKRIESALKPQARTAKRA